MITKDMTILDIIQNYPATIPVLQGLGLGCLGCIAASGESIEQGLMAHGIDVNDALNAMNEAIKGSNN